MLTDMVGMIQGQYGLFQDHEMNMISSIVSKVKDRMVDCCYSEEFLASLYAEEGEEEEEEGETADE